MQPGSGIVIEINHGAIIVPCVGFRANSAADRPSNFPPAARRDYSDIIIGRPVGKFNAIKVKKISAQEPELPAAGGIFPPFQYH